MIMKVLWRKNITATAADFIVDEETRGGRGKALA